MKFCRYCGKQLDADAKFCIGCGKAVAPPVEVPKLVCASCGETLKEGVKFCRHCGTAVASAAEEPKVTEKMIEPVVVSEPVMVSDPIEEESEPTILLAPEKENAPVAASKPVAAPQPAEREAAVSAPAANAGWVAATANQVLSEVQRAEANRQPLTAVFCGRCGHRYPVTQNFCNICGEPRAKLQATNGEAAQPYQPNYAPQNQQPVYAPQAPIVVQHQVQKEPSRGFGWIAAFAIITIVLALFLPLIGGNFIPEFDDWEFAVYFEDVWEVLEEIAEEGEWEYLFDSQYTLAVCLSYVVPLVFGVLILLGALCKSKGVCGFFSLLSVAGMGVAMFLFQDLFGSEVFFGNYNHFTVFFLIVLVTVICSFFGSLMAKKSK